MTVSSMATTTSLSNLSLDPSQDGSRSGPPTVTMCVIPKPLSSSAESWTVSHDPTYSPGATSAGLVSEVEPVGDQPSVQAPAPLHRAKRWGVAAAAAGQEGAVHHRPHWRGC